jgi:two-component system nitrogen regulation response regulator NtrX
MTDSTILIVDDEKDIRDLISDILTDDGFSCSSVGNSDATFSAIEKKLPDLILLDIWLQGSNLDGLGILEVLKSKYSGIPVIMISGHGTIETAVNSIKLGASDYIEKPFTSDKLSITVKRVFENIKLRKENKALKRKIVDKADLVGGSEKINQIKSLIEKIAPTSSKVLIHGSIGSGRELVARLIHKKSDRSRYPFVKLNSAVLLNEKAAQGIFSSATNIMDVANKGTLFINEVSNIPLNVQHTLLKIMKEHNDSKAKFDVRIIASTSKNLKQEVKEGNFLQDLYYRLNAVSIVVPTLKERIEDLPVLCDYFIHHFEKKSNLPGKVMDRKVLEIMYDYNWPGNIKQLKNVIEWLLLEAVVKDCSEITANMLPSNILSNGSNTSMFDVDVDSMSMPLRQARELFEKKYLSAQMSRFNNNISKTSAFVEMERSALHRKLKLLDIHHNSRSSTDADKEKIEAEN